VEYRALFTEDKTLLMECRNLLMKYKVHFIDDEAVFMQDRAPLSNHANDGITLANIGVV